MGLVDPYFVLIIKVYISINEACEACKRLVQADLFILFLVEACFGQRVDSSITLLCKAFVLGRHIILMYEITSIYIEGV